MRRIIPYIVILEAFPTHGEVPVAIHGDRGIPRRFPVIGRTDLIHRQLTIDVIRIGDEIGVVAANERGTGIDLEFEMCCSRRLLRLALGTKCATGLPLASNIRPTMMESLPTLLYWPVYKSQATTKLPVFAHRHGRADFAVAARTVRGGSRGTGDVWRIDADFAAGLGAVGVVNLGFDVVEKAVRLSDDGIPNDRRTGRSHSWTRRDSTAGPA